MWIYVIAGAVLGALLGVMGGSILSNLFLFSRLVALSGGLIGGVIGAFVGYLYTKDNQTRRRIVGSVLLVVGILLLVVDFLWVLLFDVYLAWMLAWNTDEERTLILLFAWVLPFAPGVFVLFLGFIIRSRAVRLWRS